MKTLYLDLNMGAAGDMLTSALLELLDDKAGFVEKLNAVGIPGVEYKMSHAEKCGVTGTQVTVTVNGDVEGEEPHHRSHTHGEEEHHHGHTHGEHHHGSMEEITHIVNDHLNIEEKIKKDVLAVYSLLADAESHVHGVPVTDIHFHEIGTMDAVADITAVCMLMDALAPDSVVASPVHVGSGQIRCAHGIMPVPAPATAYLLKDVPIYGGEIKGELCTPTGAALLKYYVKSFGDMPVMRIEKIGYGMGKKDFPAANCIRAMLGETQDKKDLVYEISCNVDDMTAEEIGFSVDALFSSGARDVFTVPIGMKKNRPGTLICAICDEERREVLIRAFFRYTSTLGVRVNALERHILDRETQTLQTEHGEVRVKRAGGYGVSREKYEYDDIARIAVEKGISLKEASQLIKNAAE